MFFDSYHDLVRVAVVGASAYLALVILLRATGKRTLSKMNAFDLVVTVALGSILAATILDDSVSLSEGILAFILLCMLQLAVTYVSVRWKAFATLVKSEPTLLFFDGRWLPGAMKRERVTQDEILAAVRAQGLGDLSEVRAVVLESDGSISVVHGQDPGQSTRTGTALAGLSLDANE
jgi:uncharacterized membrane protein YcaP (DUF421 family)